MNNPRLHPLKKLGEAPGGPLRRKLSLNHALGIPSALHHP